MTFTPIASSSAGNAYIVVERAGAMLENVDVEMGAWVTEYCEYGVEPLAAWHLEKQGDKTLLIACGFKTMTDGDESVGMPRVYDEADEKAVLSVWEVRD